jgi:hypothetical protein
MRHCHAIVGIVPTIARRVAHVASRNRSTRKGGLLGIAIGRVAVTLRIAAVVRVPILGSKSTANVITTRSARIVPRRIVATSKTIPSPPRHAIARLRVLFRVVRTIGNVGSSCVCVSVVEAHDVGGKPVGKLGRKELRPEDQSRLQKPKTNDVRGNEERGITLTIRLQRLVP